MQQPVAKRRPNFNDAIRHLLEDIARRAPEFAHIRPAKILVVAGEARRASRGTVKPLTFAGSKSRDPETGLRRPILRLNGKKILYTITLRPLFFRDADASTRIGTLLHELFHISRKFDGTLSAARRHAAMGRQFNRSLRPLVRRYLKECPKELKALFSYDGDVKIWQWLERPGLLYTPGRDSSRRVYTEAHLFLANVRMVTRRKPPLKKKAVGPLGPLH